MTFLNPAILWGLLAVSIPIIIHIFNLKKTKKIEFSTLMFLKEIQQSKYKKIKLKQLLILLCRIAVIILLVMAFARPFDTGYLGADHKAKSTVLLILDNSFSMQTRQQQSAAGGSDFDIAKSKMFETIDLLGENDEIYFSSISEMGKPNGITLYANKDELKDSIANTKISEITRYFSEVLYYAKRTLASSSNPYKEIFIFTDGQKSFIEGLSDIPFKPEFDEYTKVNIVLSGERSSNNISLDTINTVTKIFEQNRNVKLKCTINNRNNFNVSNKSVVLNFEDGRYRDEKVIDIPSNSSVEAEFNFTPGVTGYSGGFIEVIQNEIYDDEILNDNKRYFSFYVPSGVELLFASNSPDDFKYIMLALKSSEEMMRDSLNNKAEYFNIKQISGGGLTNENLNSFDCVVLVNYPSVTSAETEKLYEYVTEGGSLLIYPGIDFNIENYNNLFLNKFELPPITGKYKSDTDENTFTFESVDLLHPIFEGIFKEQKSTLNYLEKESPHISSGIILSPGRNTKTLIRLSNEKSFLTEYTSGRGKMLFYSSSPGLSGSDFPLNKIFSPLTVRSILYLSHGNQLKEAVTGRDYFVETGKFLKRENDTLLITNTSNDKYYIRTEEKFQLTNLREFLGRNSNYTIYQINNPLLKFSCNFNKSECEPVKAEINKIQEFTENEYGIDVNVISSLNTVNTAVFQLRIGTDIWQYFLIAALVFLALEFIISLSLSKVPK